MKESDSGRWSESGNENVKESENGRETERESAGGETESDVNVAVHKLKTLGVFWKQKVICVSVLGQDLEVETDTGISTLTKGT